MGQKAQKGYLEVVHRIVHKKLNLESEISIQPNDSKTPLQTKFLKYRPFILIRLASTESTE